MKKILTLTFVSFIALFLFLSNSSTPINGVTGSPGEINCYNCHSGGTGTTSVSFALNTSTPNEYKSDSTYIGTISVVNPTYILGTNRWGFEISARDTLNNKVGTCTITNSVTTILATTTKDYVKHKNANINVGTKVWSFQFKMPAAATYSGKVTFYASGMACDGTGGTGGDKLKCDSFFYTKYNPLPDINVKQIATTYLNNSTFNYGNTFKNTNNDKVFTIENLMVGTVLNISNISITGTNASLFTIIGAAPSIVNGGSSSNITVRFTPTNAGAKTANLIINSDDPDENPYTIILNGTGTVSPPIATVKQKNNIINSGGSFNYGSKTVGTNNDTIFGLYNSGDSALTFLGIPTFSGPNIGDFSVTVLPPLSILPGDSAFVTIRFTPGGNGPRSATISIPNNDQTKNPYVITFNGSGNTLGLAPELNVKQGVNNVLTGTNFNYGGAKLTTFKDTNFTIQNIGTDTLKITNISITGANASEFVIQSFPNPIIKAGDSGTVKVRFAPTAMGNRVATLVVNSNDADENPYDINLNGLGLKTENDVFVGNTAVLHTGNYAIGNVGVNKNKLINFKIINTGNDTLHVSNCNFTGTDAAQFSFLSVVSVNIPGGDSFILVVQLTPTSLGSKSAVLSIISDDANENPYVINLNANGISPELAIFVGPTAIANNGNFNYGNVGIGGFVNANFILRNTGNDTLKVANCAITGADAAQFSFQTSTTVNIPPSSLYILTVRATPISLGLKSAVLNILSDDTDENPYFINLSANGILSADINAKCNGNNILTNGNINLPSITAGTFIDTIITLENLGGDTLKINAMSFSGPGASLYGILGGTPSFILSGGTSNITVRYAPTQGGTFNSILNISSNDPNENPYLINFNATAIPGPTPDINVKESGNQVNNNGTFTFPGVPATTIASIVFTIENTGNALLSAINPKLSGANASDFIIFTKPATSIVGSGSTKFTVQFAPKTPGNKIANLVINSNDPDENPYTIVLSGNAGAVPLPEIEVQVAGNIIDTNGNFEFPATQLNVTRYISFKINNLGLGRLQNISAQLSGINASEFGIDIVPAIQIDGGLFTELKIKFTPKDYGTRRADLLILSSDAVKDSFYIFLTGNGTSAIQQLLPENISINSLEEKVVIDIMNHKNYLMTLRDINGRILIHKEIDGYLEINKSEYQKGFYFIELKDITTKEQYLKKLVF